MSQGEIGSQVWDKNGRSSPTQFFQIIDNENGEQVNDTGKMWRHDQKKVDTLRIKSMMMTVFFSSEGEDGQNRKENPPARSIFASRRSCILRPHCRNIYCSA